MTQQNQMQQNQAQPIKLTVLSTTLSEDGNSIVTTYNPPPPVSFSKSQLTLQLAQSQNRIDNLTAMLSKENAMLANLQAQIALFPVQAAQVQTIAPAS